jgi:hypothetical protein
MSSSPTANHVRSKNPERERIQAHVAAFLARGGKIETLANGAVSPGREFKKIKVEPWLTDSLQAAH